MGHPSGADLSRSIGDPSGKHSVDGFAAGLPVNYSGRHMSAQANFVCQRYTAVPPNDKCQCYAQVSALGVAEVLCGYIILGDL